MQHCLLHFEDVSLHFEGVSLHLKTQKKAPDRSEALRYLTFPDIDFYPHWGYNIYRSRGKGVIPMGAGKRKKRRLKARAARAEKIKGLAADIFTAVLADLILEAIRKWLMK